MRKIKQLLDYAATHTDTAVTYQSSNMFLAAHRNASYLSHDWSGKRYNGLTIDWNYEKQEVHISMPG